MEAIIIILIGAVIASAIAVISIGVKLKNEKKVNKDHADHIKLLSDELGTTKKSVSKLEKTVELIMDDMGVETINVWYSEIPILFNKTVHQGKVVERLPIKEVEKHLIELEKHLGIEYKSETTKGYVKKESDVQSQG